jgi:hypothetical protein
MKCGLERRGTFLANLPDTCSKLKSSTKLNGLLMDFIERAAFECDCTHESSNECSHRIWGISIAVVSATLHSIMLTKFIGFSHPIATDVTRASRVDFVGNGDGSLDVKCFVEAVSLGGK